MACFPKIDSPCPLSAAARATVGTDCSHCGHRVHHLDTMSPAARRALVRSSAGQLCVSYRLPAGLAALALSVSMPVPAQDEGFELRGPQAESVLAQPAAQAPVSPLHENAQSAPPECDELEDLVIFMGGVSQANATEWLDEQASELPELPFIREPGR